MGTTESLSPLSLHDLRLDAARQSMAAFTMYTYPGYQMGWVHEDICSELDAFLDAVIARLSPRLLITVPPRHGKSELATRRFPAFAFGRNPNFEIISTSYSADLASRMNRDVQRIMDDARYAEIFPHSSLSQSARTVANGNYLRNSDIFEIVGHRGNYRSAGVGGGITGMGGDIMLIDDPVKDREQADSHVRREKVWDWYTSTFYPRRSPGAGILLIQTRWHTDDLAGRLLEAQATGDGDEWRVINFPAIAEVDEKHRRIGEALHPERYNLDSLQQTRRAIGERDFNALYQQRPVADGGQIFKEPWLRYWFPKDLPEQFDSIILSWDMTFKDSNDSDYVVGQVWASKDADRFLLDQVRSRMSFTDTLAAFKAQAEKWPLATRKLIEDKANGPAVIDTLKHIVTGLIPVEPDGSKTARAHAVTYLFESGNVYIPHPSHCSWAKAYIAELLQFPAGAHDDQVDATTRALRDMDKRKPLFIHPSALRGPPRGRKRR